MRRFATVLVVCAIGAAATAACGTMKDTTKALPLGATFGCTGGVQTWTVPPNVHRITVTVFGADGGASEFLGTTTRGGSGGGAGGSLPVIPGETFIVTVGCPGENGTASSIDEAAGGFGAGPGGDGGPAAGGGGGGSALARPGELLFVAGGGGGAGSGTLGPPNSMGGSGGGVNGDAGRAGSGTITGGGGATSATGGAAGTGGSCVVGPTAGSPGSGGDGCDRGPGEASGGGGGGGVYGGGGGGSDTGATAGGGGGGGSGFVSASVSLGSVANGVSHLPGGLVFIGFNR